MNKFNLKALRVWGPVVFKQGERADTLENIAGGVAASFVSSPSYGYAVAAAINEALKVHRKPHHPKKKTVRERALEKTLEDAAFHLEAAALLIKESDSGTWEDDGADEVAFIADIRKLIGSKTEPCARLTAEFDEEELQQEAEGQD